MTIKNKNQWNRLLEKARCGNPDAQWEVGDYYEECFTDNSGIDIVKPKLSQALHWYTLAAEQGDDSGQLSLGRLLSTGNGVKRDMKAAFYWKMPIKIVTMNRQMRF